MRAWYGGSRSLAAVALLGSLLAAACAGGGGAPPAKPAAVSAASPAPTAAPPAPTAAPAPPAVLTTVRVGNVGASTEIGQYLAIDRGYFRELGLEIEYTRFDSAGQMTAPLGTGELDVGSGAVNAGLFNAIGRGVDLRIVGPQARYDRGGASAVFFEVAKELTDSGAYRDWPDLRGRKVAVSSRNSSMDYSLDAALRPAGLTLGDVELVELGSADTTVAFANRSIDAALHIEPQATIAAEQGLATRVMGVGDWLPGIQFTVVLYSPQFGQRDPDAARRWMIAYLKGVRDFNDAWVKGRTDREPVVDTLTRHTALKDPALILKIGWPTIDPNGAVNTDSIRSQLAWYRERGVIRDEPDLNRALDLQYAQHALAQLGEYR